MTMHSHYISDALYFMFKVVPLSTTMKLKMAFLHLQLNELINSAPFKL